MTKLATWPYLFISSCHRVVALMRCRGVERLTAETFERNAGISALSSAPEENKEEGVTYLPIGFPGMSKPATLSVSAKTSHRTRNGQCTYNSVKTFYDKSARFKLALVKAGVDIPAQ